MGGHTPGTGMEECLLNALNRLDTAPVPATIADVPAYSGLPSRYRVVERMAYPHLGRTLMVDLDRPSHPLEPSDAADIT